MVEGNTKKPHSQGQSPATCSRRLEGQPGSLESPTYFSMQEPSNANAPEEIPERRLGIE
jgi:hypothetical protein